MNRSKPIRYALQILSCLCIALAINLEDSIWADGIANEAIPLHAKISEPSKDAHGFHVHSVVSEYQADQTHVRVLLPDNLQENKRYTILFLLPVEPGDRNRYGDPLLEVKQLNLHNQYQLICVYPTFTDWPWYVDNPGNPKIRQESYMLNVILPFIENRYPASQESNRRLLLGFSKSGWGAFSLLLRYPTLFGKAAAWDAPMDMEELDQFGKVSQVTFGTLDNLKKHHILIQLNNQADQLKSTNESRLILMGYDIFRGHMEKTHEVMVSLEIPHEYQDGPKRQHHWNSGWLADAVEYLVGSRNYSELSK